VIIFTHGWLTNANNLMLIYDTVAQGYGAEELELRRAAHPALALPAVPLRIMAHWLSRRGDDLGGPLGLFDIASFSTMEARANLVGRTGMAHLIGDIWERLLADPDLTRHPDRPQLWLPSPVLHPPRARREGRPYCHGRPQP